MTEESAKFILGVIAVVLLFLLAFKLAGIMRQNTKYEQAKYTMGEIESVLNSLGDGKTEPIFVESPQDWYLVGFDNVAYDRVPYDRLPTTCGRENCVCICPDYTKESCEKKGICKVIVGKKVTIPSSCEFSRTNCFKLEFVPLMIHIASLDKGLIFKGSFTGDPQLTPTDINGNNFFYIFKDGQYQSSNILVIQNGANYLEFYPPLIVQNSTKQREFFRSRESNIVLANEIQNLRGNLQLAIRLTSPNRGTIYILSGNLVYDAVGEVKDDGSVWLAEEFLSNFFDFGPELQFYEENLQWYQRRESVISDGSSNLHIREKIFVIKKTNIWTGLKL